MAVLLHRTHPMNSTSHAEPPSVRRRAVAGVDAAPAALRHLADAAR